MIVLIILILLIGIVWPIFMLWYGSSECMEKDYQKYIKNETIKRNK